MEPAGWVLLLTSWLALSGLVWFCLRRVLHDEAAEKGPRAAHGAETTRGDGSGAP